MVQPAKCRRSLFLPVQKPVLPRWTLDIALILPFSPLLLTSQLLNFEKEWNLISRDQPRAHPTLEGRSAPFCVVPYRLHVIEKTWSSQACRHTENEVPLRGLSGDGHV